MTVLASKPIKNTLPARHWGRPSHGTELRPDDGTTEAVLSDVRVAGGDCSHVSAFADCTLVARRGPASS